MNNKAANVLVVSVLLLSGAALAEQDGISKKGGGAYSMGYVPPPPGPYISLQRNLEYTTNLPRGSWGGYPYGDAAIEGFPDYRKPYFGPGRYWAPSDWAHAHGRDGAVRQEKPEDSRSTSVSKQVPDTTAGDEGGPEIEAPADGTP